MDETIAADTIEVHTISLRRLLRLLPPLPPQAGPRHLRRAVKALETMMKQRRITRIASGGRRSRGATSIGD